MIKTLRVIGAVLIFIVLLPVSVPIVACLGALTAGHLLVELWRVVLRWSLGN